MAVNVSIYRMYTLMILVRGESAWYWGKQSMTWPLEKKSSWYIITYATPVGQNKMQAFSFVRHF